MRSAQRDTGAHAMTLAARLTRGQMRIWDCWRTEEHRLHGSKGWHDLWCEVTAVHVRLLNYQHKQCASSGDEAEQSRNSYRTQVCCLWKQRRNKSSRCKKTALILIASMAKHIQLRSRWKRWRQGAGPLQNGLRLLLSMQNVEEG